MTSPKLLRITTVPVSLKILLRGQHRFMTGQGFEVVGVSSAGSELEEVGTTEDIRTVVLAMTRAMTPWKDLKAIWQFYKLCKKERPLIVHSHTPKAGLVGMLGARLAGVPHRLHTVAGLPLTETTRMKRWLLDRVEKITYACTTRVYPNSKGLHDFILQQRYTSAAKLSVLANGSSNGIDTHYFDPIQVTEEQCHALRQSLGIAPTDFVFVFVGRMVKAKGLNELVAAFCRIRKSKGSRSRVKLLLVGNLEPELDPLSPETEKEIEANPNIIFVGYQQDVRPYFAISNCLVFPSYREGFPNVVMQAGAMGLPSIVSDINGCNEIVVAGRNGTLVPAKDTDTLATAMQHMVDDQVYHSQLRQHAREMITSRYDQQLVWNALLAEYKRLSGEKGIV